MATGLSAERWVIVEFQVSFLKEWSKEGQSLLSFEASTESPEGTIQGAFSGLPGGRFGAGNRRGKKRGGRTRDTAPLE